MPDAAPARIGYALPQCATRRATVTLNPGRPCQVRAGKIVAPRPVLDREGQARRRGTGSVAVVLDETTRKLLDGKNFATVATVNPDGGPQASVVWILRDGDTVLFSAVASRRKVLNLTRDPRVSLTVFDIANP